MIKKTITELYIYIICVALFAGCSLSEEPRDQISEAVAYSSTQELYLNCVATLYNYIGGSSDGQGLQGTCRGVYDLQTFGSDEAMLPKRGADWLDGGLWQDMYRHSWTAGHDLMKNSWLYLYKVITLCNRSLEQLDRNRSLATKAQLTAWTAEVRALRAIYYWYLADLFGQVPLVTSTSVSMASVQQTSRQDLFTFCTTELQEALPHLSAANSTHQGDYYGRITQPVALFALAKLMLNAEIYTVEVRWQECIDRCNDIERLGYDLEPSYENCFAVHNENTVENIFTIPMDKHLYANQQQNLYRSYHYRHAAAYGFTAENGSCATLKTLSVFGYGTDSQDPRFEKNYYAGTVTDLNGAIVTDRGQQPLVYHPTEVAIDLSGSPFVETAGARMKKYEVDKNALKDGKLMDNDIVLFRFSDVLLMRAEAKYRLGQDGQPDLDRVRQRAGAPLRPISLQTLLDERLLELAWEGWRRQDLIRFGQYESLYQGPDKTLEADHHTAIFPIPADVQAVNKQLQQNPGYTN